MASVNAKIKILTNSEKNRIFCLTNAAFDTKIAIGSILRNKNYKRRFPAMINLSIMPLDTAHIDEICEDIITQQETGVSTHAMFMMTFNPEGTPAVNKAEEQCKRYDLFRERLDAAGAKHGVLVQATLGHITAPFEPYPFQPSVSLITGEDRVVTCCPLDPDFRAYMKEQMRILAARKPSVVMIDDDMGLIYKATKGCACKRHMALLSERLGREISREELYTHTQGTTEEDKRITELYIGVQRDGLVGAAKAMREGLDMEDPTIQGVVSGIYASTFLEFSDKVADAFAGKGNPRIVRLNGAPYSRTSHRYFTRSLYIAACLRENAKELVDLFLAETDTCPYNRYSTSAGLLHSHFTASIFEGVCGGKHWITNLMDYEQTSGMAYRKILAKHSKFYEKLVEYVKELRPVGCRIPLPLEQNYRFTPAEFSGNLSPWPVCILGRLGLPMYYSNDPGGAVFLDDISVKKFSNTDIENFLHGTLVLSANAANTLNERGFGKYTGVEVHAWNGAVMGSECVLGRTLQVQPESKELRPISDKTEALSFVMSKAPKASDSHKLFPGVTRCKNELGGEVVVFCGTPDTEYQYWAFSLLNETRKQQFANILSEGGNLPVYYTEDIEVYLRAGYLANGELMCALFNTGFDKSEDIPLILANPPKKIEKLQPDGTRRECRFDTVDGVVRICEILDPYDPAVLFIS